MVHILFQPGEVVRAEHVGERLRVKHRVVQAVEFPDPQAVAQ